MVLERYRVFDDYDTGRLCRADKDTVDGLVGVFEGMEEEFAVCEVFEAKVRHGVKDGSVRIWVSTAGATDRGRPDASPHVLVSAWHPFVAFVGFAQCLLSFLFSDVRDPSIYIFHSRYQRSFSAYSENCGRAGTGHDRNSDSEAGTVSL